MKTGLVLILICIIILTLIGSYFTFFYRSDSQVCLLGYLFGGVCTDDINIICNPLTGEQKGMPSSCTCGLDAATLKGRGWIDCTEKPLG